MERNGNIGSETKRKVKGTETEKKMEIERKWNGNGMLSKESLY